MIVVPVFASLGPILSMFLASGAQPGPISLIWLLWLLAPALATFTIFTHIRHATNIFIVSLTFYIITHICLGLKKTQSSICADSFCKIYQLSMACYQFYLTEGICILRTHYIITYQQILMSETEKLRLRDWKIKNTHSSPVSVIRV